MSKFKEGDTVIVLRNCSGAKAGKTYKLKLMISELWATNEDGDSEKPPRDGCHCQHNWRIVQGDWDE